MAIDFRFEFLGNRTATSIGIRPVADDTECIYTLAVHQHVQSHKLFREISEQLVVHRPVPLCRTLQLVVQVIDHFSQREIVSEHGSSRREIYCASLNPAPLLAQLDGRPNKIGGQNKVDANNRLTKLGDISTIGDILRLVDFQRIACLRHNLIRDVRRRLNQVDRRLLLQPLLHNLHVQQPEKSATKTKT